MNNLNIVTYSFIEDNKPSYHAVISKPSIVYDGYTKLSASNAFDLKAQLVSYVLDNIE